MYEFIFLILILLIIEFLCFRFVLYKRKSFQWLITKSDEYPLIESNLISKFFRKSHDANLGWVRRPNTDGSEQGQEGKVYFKIDDIGSRSIPLNFLPKIACFGDSYVFCRQVNDNETWQYYCSNDLKVNFLNFGVGNYGVDQALLRYEQTDLPKSIEHVIIGFVPETICRIHSSWKHYLEFGNFLAFKPRFVIQKNGNLRLVDNIMRKENDFLDIKKYIPHFQKNDYFYKRKFLKYQFRFPFLLSFFRNPIRNIVLFSSLILESFSSIFEIFNFRLEGLSFSKLMSENIRESHNMYKDTEARTLLKEILLRFISEAKKRNHTPLVVIIPQLFDLRRGKGNFSYQTFFSGLSQSIPVLDLTDYFLETDYEKFYINDKYGGHLSSYGNLFVSKVISEHL